MNARTDAKPGAPRHLLRVVGLAFGIAAVIGGTIGGGILRTPGTIAGLLGDPLLILAVWIGCGGLVLASANSMAELAAALPRAGGPYEYCKVAFSPFAGFAVGWSDWVTNVSAIAFLSVAAAEFAAAFLELPGSAVKPLTLGLLGAVAVANWFGLRLGARVQEVLSFAKVAGLLAIVVACFWHAARVGHTGLAAATGSAAAMTPVALVLAIVRSMQLMYETYQGWNAGVYFAEEDRAGGRNLPRAMFTGIAIVIAVYVLVNVAVLLVVPVEQLATSKLAVADAADVVFGGAAERTVTALAFVSLLGILNITAMFTPRVLFALGRDGLGVRRAAEINAWGAPASATLISLGVSAVMASIGSFEALFELTATIGMIVNSATMLALFRLRRTHPDLDRPYRARGYPWLPATALATTLALLVAVSIANTAVSAVAVGLLCLSYPAYRSIRRSAGDGPPAGTRD